MCRALVGVALVFVAVLCGFAYPRLHHSGSLSLYRKNHAYPVDAQCVSRAGLTALVSCFTGGPYCSRSSTGSTARAFPAVQKRYTGRLGCQPDKHGTHFKDNTFERLRTVLAHSISKIHGATAPHVSSSPFHLSIRLTDVLSSRRHMSPAVNDVPLRRPQRSEKALVTHRSLRSGGSFSRDHRKDVGSPFLPTEYSNVCPRASLNPTSQRLHKTGKRKRAPTHPLKKSAAHSNIMTLPSSRGSSDDKHPHRSSARHPRSHEGGTRRTSH
jgi:hypothetical protein